VASFLSSWSVLPTRFACEYWECVQCFFGHLIDSGCILSDICSLLPTREELLLSRSRTRYSLLTFLVSETFSSYDISFNFGSRARRRFHKKTVVSESIHVFRCNHATRLVFSSAEILRQAVFFEHAFRSWYIVLFYPYSSSCFCEMMEMIQILPVFLCILIFADVITMQSWEACLMSADRRTTRW
jgi:hypothetical protein